MSLLAGQVHYLSATTPKWKLASRPGAAPGKLSFGDSAAQAGARLIGNWCGCRELHPDILHGGGTFYCLITAAREIKRPGGHPPPRPAPFQQRTNTSCYLAIPTHGFTVVLSVFGGTPPAKPLKCKIRPNSSGALVGDPWADPTGGEPRLSRAFLCFVPGDII